jgi:hypothetical protein
MSESEKFEAQGRAHAGLKEAKSNAATIRASLLNYGKRLGEASAFLKQFLADPLTHGANQVPISECLKGDFRNLKSSSFENNVDQLVAEVKRAQELQQQIDNF